MLSVIRCLKTHLALSALLLCCLAGPAQSAIFTWDRDVSTDWFNSSNWSPTGVPGPNDTAIIMSSTVDISGGDVTVANMVLDIGSVIGDQTLTITNNFAWNSGVIAVKMTIPSGATVDMTGNGTKNVSAVITNNGTFNWRDQGSVAASSGGVFNNNGTFNAAANTSWFYNGGEGQAFNNTGTFNEVAGGGVTSQFGNATNFCNTGTVNVQTGILALSNGSSTGTFNVAENASLIFNGGPHTLTGGASFTGVGKSRIVVGGLVSLSGSIAGGINGGTFELDGGLLTSPVDGGSVTGSLVLTSGQLAGLLTNLGTTTWRGGNGIAANDGLVFNNNGTFNATSSSSWFYNGGTGQTFNNNGVFNEVAAAGVTSSLGANTNFCNHGTVNGVTGILALADGTSHGTFNAAAEGSVIFNNSVHTLTGSATFTGPGQSRIVTGGTGRIDGDIVGGSGGGTLELFGGLLTTPPTGGTVTGTLLLTAGAVGGVITNAGTTTWAGGNGIAANDGSIFNNNSVFNVSSSSSWFYNGGTGQTFNNVGTLNEVAAAGVTSQFGDKIDFRNTGTVNSQTGTLALASGSSNGIFNVATGARLIFNSSPHILKENARCTGPGQVEIVTGGTVQVEGTIIGGVGGGTLELNGGLLTSAPAGGTVTGLLQLNAGGVAGIINANGTTNWTGGNGIAVNSGSVFNNNGTFNASSSSSWFYNGGTGQTFNNNGVFNEVAAAGVTSQFGNNTNFCNKGTINGQSGTLALSNGTSTGVFNTGATGLIRFNGNPHTLTAGARSTGTGRTQVVTGGTVIISGAIVGGVGTGIFELLGGLITTSAGGGTITGNLTLTAGALAGTINANGTTSWEGGNGIAANNGLIFNNNGTFNAISSSTWFYNGGIGQAFNNNGIFNEKAAAGVTSQFGNGTNFCNKGTVNGQSGTLALANGTSTGTFNSTNGEIVFNGTPHVLTGGAKFTGTKNRVVTGGTASIMGSIVGGTSGGTFELAGGLITGGTGGGTITGSLLLSSGALAGALAIAPGAVGTWTGGNGIAANSGLIFTNNGTFNINSTSSWFYNGGSGQTFNNAGTIIKTGASAASAAQFGNGTNFKNTGVVNVQSGILNLANGTSRGTFNVISPALLQFNSDVHTLTGNARFTGTGKSRVVVGGVASIDGSIIGGADGGTFELAGGQLTSPVGGAGTVTGTLLLSGGAVAGTLTNAGITTWSGNSIAANNGSVFNNNGTFHAMSGVNWFYNSGSGQVFRNNKLMLLAPKIGVSITIPFVQSATGVVDVNIAGSAAGSGFNQLNLGGTVTLGGTLSANVLSPFQPQPAQRFPVVTYGAGKAGTTKFASVTGGFTADYSSGNKVELVTGNGGFPGITGFTPASGVAGATVTITGSALTGATSVKFGGVVAPGFTVGSGGTQITVKVPVGALTGKITVTTTSGTAASVNSFTVSVPPPTIASFIPASGKAGTQVTITGSNFTAVTDVKFKGVAAEFALLSATQIRATVPATAQNGTISVTTLSGTANSTGVFTVLQGPAIFSFAPISGIVQTEVTINGKNFTGATIVRFNNKSTTAITVLSDTQIKAKVPVGTVTGPIAVITNIGSSPDTGQFVVLAPPVITTFSPASGAVGSTVSISGTGFTGLRTLRFFNDKIPSILSVSDTLILAKVPVGATTGPISVSTGLGGMSTKGSFFVVPGAPPRAATTGLSAAVADAGQSSVALTFSSALTPESVGDASHFAVSVNGVAVEVEGVGYNGGTRTAILALSAGTMRAGDRLEVKWSRLEGVGGQLLQGSTTVTAGG